SPPPPPDAISRAERHKDPGFAFRTPRHGFAGRDGQGCRAGNRALHPCVSAGKAGGLSDQRIHKDLLAAHPTHPSQSMHRGGGACLKLSVSAPGSAGEKGPRKRRPGSTSAAGAAGGDTHSETRQVAVETLHCVETDTSPDALQKAVRFSDDLTLLATGGADGFLRVWEFPSMKKSLEFQAHKGEIEDIALSPDNKVVTVGWYFQCCVWQRDQLVTGLHWNENLPGVPDKAYRYQACRFGRVEDQGGALRLYTVQIPHKRERRPPPCYLTKWDGHSFLPLLTRPCGTEVVSCLAVSDTGTFLGLGSVTGSVAICASFSLQRLYYVREAHGIVVTDLAFLPTSHQGQKLLGDNEVALLSVAVDSRCRLHQIPCRRSFPVWLLLLLCAGLVVASILLLQLAFPGFL
uniref:Prolactin regulatory element binding n=1 Tax=Sphenodon punctatus TaxID=8508 RepID=A0A8D0HDR8_SPHPU